MYELNKCTCDPQIVYVALSVSTVNSSPHCHDQNGSLAAVIFKKENKGVS
jgi:hypothetical protein